MLDAGDELDRHPRVAGPKWRTDAGHAGAQRAVYAALLVGIFRVLSLVGVGT